MANGWGPGSPFPGHSETVTAKRKRGAILITACAGLAAICFIVAEQNILLMKHSASSFASGRWSVIGGKVDQGETPDAAIRREVEEETGLNVPQCKHAGHILLYEGKGVTSLNLYVATDHQGGDSRQPGGRSSLVATR